MKVIAGVTLFVIVFLSLRLNAQDTLSISPRLAKKYVVAVSEKAAGLQRSVDTKTAGYVGKVSGAEKRLQQKLQKLNPGLAGKLFPRGAALYGQFQKNFQDKTAGVNKMTGRLEAWQDSTMTTLTWLKVKTGAANAALDKADAAELSVQSLGTSLDRAADLSESLRQRQLSLSQALAPYHLQGLMKDYNTQVGYYASQVKEWKEAMSDRAKAEQKLLGLLNEYGPFKHFFETHSALAGLFNLPAGGDPGNLSGLQTLSQVQGALQTRIVSMGPQGVQLMQAGLSQAQSALAGLRNRLNSGSKDANLPSFQPNTQKVKPLHKRLFYGLDMQTSPGNNFMPNYTDIALSAGLRLKDGLSTGISVAYKLGYGKDWKHIQFSSMGMALRSFLDWKLKKSFWLSGGLELNYLSPFDSIKELKDYNAWKKAALLGFSKTVSLKSKYFKNTKVSLLYDFLHASAAPPTPAVVFRAGYQF